jgi:SAM-dependent methyltransferase
MSQTHKHAPASDAKQLWEESFEEQIARQAYNTAAVEALVRSVSYYLRDRYSLQQLRSLDFVEMGCGAGPNLLWLAAKGIRVSGVDIAPSALELARNNLARAGMSDRTGLLVDASVVNTPFDTESFHGVLEACVFQHLGKDDRRAAFAEVRRILKPGGLFVGYMLDQGHTVFQKMKEQQRADDPGTLYLADGGSKIHLTNIGTAHFFAKDELFELLDGFQTVDPCLTTYYVPAEEARKRGYAEYLQSMWIVYAIK